MLYIIWDVYGCEVLRLRKNTNTWDEFIWAICWFLYIFFLHLRRKLRQFQWNHIIDFKSTKVMCTLSPWSINVINEIFIHTTKNALNQPPGWNIFSILNLNIHLNRQPLQLCQAYTISSRTIYSTSHKIFFLNYNPFSSHNLRQQIEYHPLQNP